MYYYGYTYSMTCTTVARRSVFSYTTLGELALLEVGDDHGDDHARQADDLRQRVAEGL